VRSPEGETLEGTSAEDAATAEPPEGDLEEADRHLREELSNLEEDEEQLRKDRVELARDPTKAIDEIAAPPSQPETGRHETSDIAPADQSTGDKS